MREEVIAYVKSQAPTGYHISEELPFVEGVAKYLKQPKTVFVDATQTATEPFIQTLDDLEISNKVTSVTIYFAVDAKNKPANYESTVDTLKAAKNITTLEGANSRTVTVSTEFVEDLLVTSLEIQLTRITRR
jgi:tripartite-type tricarboxylate transporter receptor subunit TctC